MTSASPNPWTTRFNEILNVDEIKRRANRLAHPLLSLDTDTTEHACARIQIELDEVFVTTSRVAEIIKKMIECAQSHSLSSYPDVPSFMRQCYAEHDGNSANKKQCFPHILTGPSGTGKTQLGRAILRVFPLPSFIQTDQYHPKFPLVTVERIAIDVAPAMSVLLHTLSPPTGVPIGRQKKVANLVEDCARWQYKCGTSLLIADELQFVSQSEKASARVSQILLALSYLRLPTLVIANYSLIHKLNRRPQEDRRRLLGKPLILLLPDLPVSADWSAVLTEYQRAVPGVYQFDFGEKRKELWSLCAGLKGELVKLLVLAYAQCRRRHQNIVVWQDIESAYRSPDFFLQRRDIEEFISQAFGIASGRDDLRCPIPTGATEEQEYLMALKEIRQKKVAEAALAESMSKIERDALKRNQDPEPDGRSINQPASPKRMESLSAEDLKKNNEKYMAQIKK